MTLTIGSDPEVILVNKHGKLISSVGLVGGSKLEPMKTKHGYVQEDNVLVEFNTHPSKTRLEFIKNHLDVLKDIEDLIKPLDLSVDIQSSGLFDVDQLQSFEAMEAGCDPDYNAWSVMENDKPDLASTQLRTCGGHLHIGFSMAKKRAESRLELVKALDLTLGVPSVLLDKDKQRRSLYGKAGAFRPKFKTSGDPYDGIEYRTLSNFWIKSPDVMGWVFDTVQSAVGNLGALVDIANKEMRIIQEAIDTSNEDIARHLIDKYKLEVAYA